MSNLFKAILEFIKKQPLIVVIVLLLLLIGNKQSTIERLRKVIDTPTVTYVRDTVLKVIEVPIPIDPVLIASPTELIVSGVDIINTSTKKDTSMVFKTLKEAYIDYTTEKKYTGIAEDDYSMYIGWAASVKHNSLQSLEISRKNRYPYTITNKIEVTPIRILGGAGIYNNGINLQ